jgi:hypothetical protein
MICLNCNKEFEGRKKKHCSDKCRYNYRNRDGRRNEYIRLHQREHPYKRPPRTDIQVVMCPITNQLFISHGRSKSKYHPSVRDCIKEKKKQKDKEIARVKALEIWYTNNPRKTLNCLECNKSFIGTKCRIYCSSDCSKKAGIRSSRISRKMLERKAFIEHVNPMKVFKRDNYKCKLCGCDTPLSLRGKHEPNSPELDHIIPISKGGKHSYSNTQLLCRQCNQDKSDKIFPNIGGVIAISATDTPVTSFLLNFMHANDPNRGVFRMIPNKL